MQRVDPLSGVSLHIEAYFNETYLASGTGFVIKKAIETYLVTNWHVFSGKEPTKQTVISDTGGIPNRIVVWHHVKDKLGTWKSIDYRLWSENDDPIWIAKSLPNGEMIDVALLKIDLVDPLVFYDLDLSFSVSKMNVFPSEAVSIIGFPFGRASAGKFPIWKTGHIASDIDLNVDNKPAFFIDATTKPGMSGSPVIAKRVGSYPIEGGIAMGSAVKFMGIYSGRIQDDEKVATSNLGLVWKPETIEFLLAKN